MKKILLLVLVLTGTLSLKAQRAGNLWVGLSTDLTGSSLLYAPIRPTVLYFLNENVAIGGAITWVKVSDENLGRFEATARAYLTKNLFGEGGFSSDFNGHSGYILGVGATSFWGSRLYIEPKFGYQYQQDVVDIQGVKLSLGVGIKI